MDTRTRTIPSIYVFTDSIANAASLLPLSALPPPPVTLSPVQGDWNTNKWWGDRLQGYSSSREQTNI